MLCFRPTKKQNQAMASVSNRNKVFESAYLRWKAGELVIGNPANFTDKVLKGQIGSPFVLSKDYEDIPNSETARAILEAHLFIDPIRFDKQIQSLDENIAALMGEYSGAVAIDAATGEKIRERKGN